MAGWEYFDGEDFPDLTANASTPRRRALIRDSENKGQASNVQEDSLDVPYFPNLTFEGVCWFFAQDRPTELYLRFHLLLGDSSGFLWRVRSVLNR